MTHLIISLSAILLATTVSCNNESATETASDNPKEIENYTNCLSDYFSNLPLESCPSFASSDSEMRNIKIEDDEKQLNVSIEIPECLHQLQLYHSWIASELHASCLENKATRFYFTDKEFKPYFSVVSDSIPRYFTAGNRDAYIEKQISDSDVVLVKSVLFSDKLPSESSYYVYLENNEIIICAIRNIEAGNRQDNLDAISFLSELKSNVDSIELSKTVTFQIMEHYGRTIHRL